MNNACSTQVKYSSVDRCLQGGRGRIFCVYCYAFYSSAFQGGLFCLSIYLRKKKKCSNVYSHTGAWKLSIQTCRGGALLCVWIKGSSTVAVEEKSDRYFLHFLQLHFFLTKLEELKPMTF